MSTADDPLLFIDYCRIRDKYYLLTEMARGLAPRRLVVVDGFAAGWSCLTARERESMQLVAAPRGVFYSKPSWRTVLARGPSTFPRELLGLAQAYTVLSAERYPRVVERRAKQAVVTAWKFADTMIRRVRPGLVVLWNAFHPLSKAAEHAARQHGVRSAYLEYGLLPGTFNFDFRGQMGESAVALEPAFHRLALDASDLERADDVLESLRRTGTNRRPQPRIDEALLDVRMRAGGRPVLLLAGHNDHASGVIPYEGPARTAHSPIFQSSADAALRVERLAAARGWFVVYKPHPFAKRAQHVDDTAHSMTLPVGDINACIDMADVVLTVLSQVSYVAMIRRKPVVMLGYNQLRGAGCAYQCHTWSDVEPRIDAALSEGLTQEQDGAWRAHVARLLKYYLYGDGSGAIVGVRPPEALGRTLARALESHEFVDFADAERHDATLSDAAAQQVGRN